VATKKRPDPPEVEQLRVRRGRTEQKPLPPHLDAFARGDDDALWRRERRGGQIDDPRPIVLIPGVKNADARVVFDARIRRLHEAQTEKDEKTLSRELAEAFLLGLWRANNVVSFDALAEVALGLTLAEAKRLALIGKEELHLPDRLSDAEIAVWMRAEAGLLEACEEARVRYANERLILSVPIEFAAHALAAAGRREAPLERVPMGSETVLDRPRGVPSMKSVIERERRIKDGE
jgi:hypothetical protein